MKCEKCHKYIKKGKEKDCEKYLMCGDCFKKHKQNNKFKKIPQVQWVIKRIEELASESNKTSQDGLKHQIHTDIRRYKDK